MKALQFFGKQDLRFVDLPKPQINDEEVLMKVKKVGICGTDLHIYNGGMNVPVPLVMGHEFVGDIVKIGNKVTNIKVGDRAVAEHVIGCGKCLYCREGKKTSAKIQLFLVIIGKARSQNIFLYPQVWFLNYLRNFPTMKAF